MKYDTEQVRAVRDLATEYLGNGGLFNPELMRHDAVRDLVIKCRAILDAWLASEYPKLREDAERYRHWRDLVVRDNTTSISAAEQEDTFFPLLEAKTHSDIDRLLDAARKP